MPECQQLQTQRDEDFFAAALPHQQKSKGQYFQSHESCEHGLSLKIEPRLIRGIGKSGYRGVVLNATTGATPEL